MASSLTEYVARFIVETAPSRIPSEVMHLGKRSILDGLGLALAGNAAESGHLVRAYLRKLGIPTKRGATVIGTGLKVPARFAALTAKGRTQIEQASSDARPWPCGAFA